MNVLSALLIIFGSYYLAQVFQTNMFFRNFMESILKVSGIPGTAVLMLPLGFTIGVTVNLIIHWIGFNYHFPSFSKPVLRTLFEVFSASTIMGFVAYEFLVVFSTVFNLDTLTGIFLQGFCSGIIGIISAIFILYLLKSQELSEVWSTLHKRIWRAEVIVPDAELQ